VSQDVSLPASEEEKILFVSLQRRGYSLRSLPLSSAQSGLTCNHPCLAQWASTKQVKEPCQTHLPKLSVVQSSVAARLPQLTWAEASGMD